MEELILCDNKKHYKPKSEFIGKNGNIRKTCSECQQAKVEYNRKRTAEMSKSNIVFGPQLDPTWIKCKQEAHILPREHFIGERGELVKTCSECRDRLKKKRKEKQPVMREQDPNLVYCKMSNHWKPASDFIGRKGVVVKTCEHCRLKIERHQKANMTTIINNRRLRRHTDIDYKIHLRKVNKKWRDNNPENMLKMRKNFRYIFNQYKTAAKKRKLDFELTLNQFTKMIQSKCFYCDRAPPENSRNGIDRYNNSLDYSLQNCVSACKMCNSSKMEWSATSFVAICGHIATSAGKEGGPLIGHLFPDQNYDAKFAVCKGGAKKRKLDFKITLEEFQAETAKPCIYCKRPPSATHENSLDRISSKLGYIDGNIQACCSVCNILKYTYEHEEFLEQCSAIWINCHDKVDPLQGFLEKERRVTNAVSIK